MSDETKKPADNAIESSTLLCECVRMLKFAQKELDVLYHFAISNGICEAVTPPHETIKEFLNENKLT
jgi:hypothetical protein